MRSDDGVVMSRPVAAVPTRWLIGLMCVNLGTYIAWFGPLQSLLPQQAEHLDAANKETILAWVTGFGAVVSLVTVPLAGALSDRTTNRLGRRAPWVFGGVILTVTGLLVLAWAGSVALMILGWCLVQAGGNCAYAGITAAIPDQVPEQQRAFAGGMVGLGQNLGILLGVGVATAAGGIRTGFIACAVLAAMLAVPYLRNTRDRQVTDVPTTGVGQILRGMWISPRKYPDFGWAWISRFFVMSAIALATLYLYYFLKDYVKVDSPKTGVFILIVTYSVIAVVTAIITGRISDRSGKRKRPVQAAAALVAVAALILGCIPAWPAAIIGACVMGLGFGAFISVDLAIATQVLPNADDRGKDLGVINIANALPQVLAPVVAAPIVTHLGGYQTLFICSAVLALAGAATVTRIRAVS